MLLTTAIAVATLADPAAARLQLAHLVPQARIHVAPDGRLDRIHGTTLATGHSPRASTTAFINEHLDLWNLQVEELEAAKSVSMGTQRRKIQSPF